MQLRRDAELEVEVERVVVRLERPRRSAARLLRLVQRRRLHLEVRAHRGSAGSSRRSGALHERLAHARRGDEVEVALPVPLLDVGEPVPLLRQGPHRLREDREAGRLERELARLRARGRRARRRCLRCRAACRSRSLAPSRSFLSQTCSSPAASLILRNAALPNGRTARTRPAIDQAPGSFSDLLRGRVAVPLARSFERWSGRWPLPYGFTPSARSASAFFRDAR